jgi:hypothetical protein
MKPALLKFLAGVICCVLLFHAQYFLNNHQVFAQGDSVDLNLDLASGTIPLPAIFQPNIDLSGRGFHHELSWPQEIASAEALDTWQEDIGFAGVYRLQYNLWEIYDLAKNRQLQERLLKNYEEIIKRVNDTGGVVILDIFGTPAGLGKVLDKKSPPWDMRAFKELLKAHIRNLSCIKKYNIWYEVWNAPDLDDFFIGRQQEYLNLYRAVAETIKELEREYKTHIPLGGPSVSWWFQSLDGNNIVTPERSLIYELIKNASHYRLPLDFISWHSYTTDPQIDKEMTSYNKTSVALIRDWLSYFNLNKNTPLIVDEWNYDSGANLLPARHERGNIAASYALSRIKNMYGAGLDYQLYFCLEDFQNNKEGVVRNVGVFWFNQDSSGYKSGPKSVYNLFRGLAALGNGMYAGVKTNDEFVDALAAKSTGSFTLLIYNYIDPNLANSYISRTIAGLNAAERKMMLGLINSDKLEKVLARELDPASLRVTNKVKGVLKKAQELNDKGARFSSVAREVKLSLKNLKENYTYERYLIDASCSLDCAFTAIEKKDVAAAELYQETLRLQPYSVQMIILKLKPKIPEPVVVPLAAEPPAINATTQLNNATLGAVSNTTIEASKPAEAQNLTGLADRK